MSFNFFIRYLIYFILIFYSNLAVANQTILYIDMSYLMNNSLAGKSIVEQLKKQSEKNVNTFKKIEKDLKSEEDKLISQKSILDPEEFKKKVEIFREKVSNYNIERNNKNENLSKQKGDAQKILLESIDPILKEYSKKNSVSYIISKQNIILGQTELDITKKILKLLNENLKKIDIK